MSLRGGVVWLFLLFDALVFIRTHNHRKCRHERTETQWGLHSVRKLCHPSAGSQTAGAITQKCSRGLYREWSGPERGRCVPCRCGGLSDECDDHTGKCLKCQFNTAGDHCERCQEGYYGNTADRTCRACPCPFAWSNAALACAEVSSGEVECLCKRSHAGDRCERCASGYYGDPTLPGGSCKPCDCNNGDLNLCDSLTGECITPGDSGSGDDCQQCDSCTDILLVNSHKVDDALVLLKHQLQNISHLSVSLSWLKDLEANISETEILVRRYAGAVSQLNPKVEQLETDVDVVRVDLSQLIDEMFEKSSYAEKVFQNGNATRMEAEKLFSEAEALLTATADLINELREMKAGDLIAPSGKGTTSMVTEAQRLVGEMKERSCTGRREQAGKEREEANKLLASANVTYNAESSQTALNRCEGSLMSSLSPLRELAELLLGAEDAVGRSQGLNLESGASLQHLQHLHNQLQAEQRALRPVTQTAADLLKNLTGTHQVLDDIKKDSEQHLARLDGAKRKLLKNMNNVGISAIMDKVTKAEEHAEELSRLATDIQHVSNSTERLGTLGKGPYNSIINIIEDADAASNQSYSAVSGVLEDRGLFNRAEELNDYSSYIWTNANKSLSDLETLSNAVNIQKDGLNERVEKGKSLQMQISALGDELKEIERDDTETLLESAKRAASDSNNTASNVRERVKKIRQDLKGITGGSSAGGSVDGTLGDAEHTLRSLTSTLPKLRDKRLQVEALSRRSHPSANMSESIRRIKDVIAETRSFVNRVPLATTFNGKAHVELHPPRNPEDLKAFTSVDLLLNLHQTNPPKKERGRRRRQHGQRDADLFVFYLGGKNASGDYIGMAVRRNVLVCVYKLGGVAHQVETSRITTTTGVNSSDFDRVLFHRVYQDAGVNITHNFTSQSPVRQKPKLNLPSTMSGILNLDLDSLVFYVGGYPGDFKPPVELRYPNYRGDMRLSYINDQPLCLFNYKRALHLDAKQAVPIPQSELSDYYEGTGYRMALITRKKRLFKFHTNSRETNALLFYIGNEDSFFCVLVERGLLVLRGRQAGRDLRAQSRDKVSLFDENFAITIADKFVVHFGPKRISTGHADTAYTAFYIGGLPSHLRQRFSISAPPLRGCVDHLTADTEFVQYSTTIGVSVGCPVLMLGVRSATLTSALPADSMFAWGNHLLTQRVSVGFKSTDRHVAILSSQRSSAALQLSLADGYVAFRTGNYTLKSDKRYNDGRWHYLSAAKEPTRLELSVDNVSVNPRHHITTEDQNSQEGKFQGCIANLYYRSEPSFIPADLSSFSESGASDPCSFSPRLPQTSLSLAPKEWQPSKPKPTPAGSWCGKQRSGYRLSEHSWLGYKLPLEELNHRPHFSLDVKTTSSKGRILYMAGRGAVPLLALYVANGKMKVSLGRDRIIQHGQRSNDGQWHRVEISVEEKTFHLLVDGVRVTDGVLRNSEGSSLDFHPHVYLGGNALGKTMKGHDIPVNGVSGCIRDLRLNNVAVGQPEASNAASLCLDELTEPGTYFAGGHIILENYVTVGSHFALAFEMRPQHLTGVLFHTHSHNTSLSVFFVEDKVEVVVNDGHGAINVSVPARKLCDGEFHAVTVTKQHEVIKLTVDSMSDQKAGPKRLAPTSETPNALYIGGATDQKAAPLSSPFLGCLRNVKMNGGTVAFGTESRVGQVNLNECPAD